MVVADWCTANLRDASGWAASKLPVTASSDDALKMYDASVRQVISWLDEDTLGGIQTTLDNMLAADEYFVLGRAFACGLELLGTGTQPIFNLEFGEKISKLKACTEKNKQLLSEREILHVNAVIDFSHGDIIGACHNWEKVLTDHPNDMHALKFAHDCYFYLGDSENIRDSIKRVISVLSPCEPLYGHVKGMLAFGYEECNQFDKGEACAKEALSLNRHDAWATHALAHVYEMQGRTDEGVRFLTGTVKDWEPCNYLACHNMWHWAVYHIERQEYRIALDIFEREIGRRCQSGFMLDIVDASSILYRLKLEGFTVSEKCWETVLAACNDHLNDHTLVFNDAMMLMALLGHRNESLVKQQLQSVREFLKKAEEGNTQKELYEKLGLPIFDAMIAFDEARYDECVAILYPIRKQISKIGGSNAQRDVFNQLLIHACLLSNRPDDIKKADALLKERQAANRQSKLTQRLVAKCKHQ